jgi:hypothetical protein
MNEHTYERPGTVTAIALITLISGVINVIWGLIASFSFGVTIIFLCLVPLFIAQVVLGVYEIVYAARLLFTPPQPVQPSKSIAVCEIATILVGNVISLVVGILALVFYNDPAVIGHFARINGEPVPAPAAPVAPVPPAAPALPVEPAAQPPAELPAPEVPEKPEKKPRRKMAA